MIASVTPLHPETVASRIRALQDEARQLADDHMTSLVTAMQNTASLALDIHNGGDVYPPGVRDLALRFAEETDAKAQTIQALLARQL